MNPLDHLNAYFIQESIQLSNIEWHSPDQKTILVRATSDLCIDEVIATIPKDAILSIKNCGIADLLEEYELSGSIALALALLYGNSQKLDQPFYSSERSLGKASPYYHYIASLPIKEYIPLLWSPADRYMLAGTDLGDAIQMDMEFFSHDYDSLILPLIEENPLIFSDSKQFNLERFLEASSLVSSRAFQVDDYHGEALVPLADAFNHKTDGEHVHFECNPNVCPECGSAGMCECYLIDNEFDMEEDGSEHSWESVSGDDQISDEEGIEEGECPRLVNPADARDDETEPDSDTESISDKMMDMRIVSPCPSGTEVFNTYGLRSNTYLLNRYGFAELGNPYNIVLVTCDEIIEPLGQIVSKTLFSERMNVWESTGWKMCARIQDRVERQEEEDCSESDDENEALEDGGSCFLLDARGSPNLDLLACLSLVLMPKPTFKQITRTQDSLYNYCEAIASLLHPHFQPRKVTSKKVMDLLQSLQQNITGVLGLIAKNRLDRYPTCLNQDQKLWNSMNQGDKGPLFWALILRMSEKEILKKTIAKASHIERNK